MEFVLLQKCLPSTKHASLGPLKVRGTDSPWSCHAPELGRISCELRSTNSGSCGRTCSSVKASSSFSSISFILLANARSWRESRESQDAVTTPKGYSVLVDNARLEVSFWRSASLWLLFIR
eukprot:scaffold962_cov372-Prasinococcus_capsulatus_cf.AAC.3